MTDRIKNISRLIFFVVLFIIFNGLCIYYEKYTANNLSSVSARYDKASISPKQIEKALLNQSSASQSGITDITLWNRLKKETIQSTVTKLKQETHVIEVYGDMSKVLPMTFLCGNYVYGKDITGCVLDMETAYQLFGSTDIINNIVLWKGKKYYVRGVVKAKDTIMLIQISDDNYLFSNVEAVCSEKVKHRIADNEGCQLKNMLTDHGAPEPDAVIDGVLTLWIIHIICHLPLWMIVITAIILMFKDTFRLRPSKALFLLSAAGTMLITLILIKLSDLSVHIPNQFIPAKWSDFNFYIDKFKEMKAAVLQRMSCTLMPLDILRINIIITCILLTTVNIILLIFFNMKTHSLKEDTKVPSLL